MVGYRLLIVDGGFDGDGAVDEEGITHLHRRHYIVVVVAAMLVCSTSPQIDTVLDDIIAPLGTDGESVGGDIIAS